jgi:hypothetical protein
LKGQANSLSLFILVVVKNRAVNAYGDLRDSFFSVKEFPSRLLREFRFAECRRAKL